MIKQAIFHLKRDIYRGKTTLGQIFKPNGTLFGYTLEDVVRAYGIKDKHNTAIPATERDFTYYLGVRQSPKYGEVAVIYTSKNGDVYTLSNEGISFEQILVHGGNSAEDTSGCIIVAKTRDTENMTVQGTLKVQFKDKVQEFIDDGYDCRLRITNISQKE